MEKVERTFNWTLSKVYAFMIALMGFALEVVVISLGKGVSIYFIAAVGIGGGLVVGKQINDTVRTLK